MLVFVFLKYFFMSYIAKKKKWQLYVNPSLLILFVNKIQTSRQKRQECLWVTLYLQWQMRQRRHFMVQFHQFQAFKSRRSSRKEIVSGTTPKSKLGFSPHNLRIIAINSEWLILFPSSMFPRILQVLNSEFWWEKPVFTQHMLNLLNTRHALSNNQ